MPLGIVFFVLCPSWAAAIASYFAGGMLIFTNQAIKQSKLHCCLLVCIFLYFNFQMLI